MPCAPEVLKNIPLFALLDDERLRYWPARLSSRHSPPRQRIYKIGDPGGRGLCRGLRRGARHHRGRGSSGSDGGRTVGGRVFRLRLHAGQTPHQTSAVAIEEAMCIEVDRDDISVLLQRKPHAGMDMLTVLGRQFHASQQLVRVRATRNPNEVIEEEATLGEHIADTVARFGGSWTFIITFCVVLVRLYGA